MGEEAVFCLQKKPKLWIPFSWENRRAILLEKFLYIPHLPSHENWDPIPWSDERVFGNNRPVHIEFCSGNGEWIASQAIQEPNINWVAVEKRFDRARKIWNRLFRERLTNLWVVCGEGFTFARHYLPLQGVEAMFVNFPDPWPKLRHAKHRLIRAEFLKTVGDKMNIGGRALFVTDDYSYLREMMEQLSLSNCFEPLLPKPYYTLEWKGYGSSFFDTLWRQKKREIYYLPYRRH